VAVLSFGQAAAPVFPEVMDEFPAGVLTSVTAIDPALPHARTMQATVQGERQLGPTSSLTVTYTRLDGRHILMSRNVNAPTLSAARAAALGVPNLGRPDPNFGNVGRYEGIGRSQYDGLTGSLAWRRAGWGQLRVSYTFSRALDDSGNFFFSAPQDNSDVHADWGPSDNDQRHRLVVSGTHSAGPATGAGWWRQLAGGWQVAYIFGYASAPPFNVQTGTDRNNDTTVNDRPPGVGRNSARGFSSASLDLRLGRAFTLAGRARLEVMADAFNVLNRSNLQIPNNVVGVGPVPLPSFGRATAAGDPRQFQLGARVTF
jgi:hypothetical protein